MANGEYILVGDSTSPRGVAVIVNGETILLGVKAAREIAQTLLTVADLVEQTGGAAPEVEEFDVEAKDEFIREKGFRVRGRS
jgi:sulfur carrier protein ThiS